MEKKKVYAAIDLKSFYASVECIQRGLDPLTTNLVVADAERTEKTICLAVSPSLKSHGIPGRCRLFELIQQVDSCNAQRRLKAPGHVFSGTSWHAPDLECNPSLSIDYIVATPHMSHYIEFSTQIYRIYLKYVAPEDIHIYSIDEVFLDITPYLKSSGLHAYQFVQRILQDIWHSTSITATAGIGPNLYLSKIAMDIVAKRIQPNEDGIRIAELDEASYRASLWNHRPLTDFWRIGSGIAKKLEAHGMFTMGDVAKCSLGAPTAYHNEDLLYRLFGINAELLIDHAWGWEPCTIADIKAYSPTSSSLCSGQVLQCPYPFEKARLVVQEMTDLLVLDLVDQNLLTDQIVLTIGYDIENLTDPKRCHSYSGPITIDHYGRKIPKHAHGTANLGKHSSSTKEILCAVTALYNRIVNPNLLVRRITLSANHLLDIANAEVYPFQQLDLFSPRDAASDLSRERRLQKATLQLKKKYGKNAILKGINLQDGATAADRNRQIGGHKA